MISVLVGHDVVVTPARQIEVSEREGQVLAALGARMSNAQIAGRLHISIRTVEGHVSSLLRKYGLADRRALAAVAKVVGQGVPPARLTGVPDARTSFIGRTAELDLVRIALREDRLVTLLGPGGVGKTRLAAVAAEAVMSSFPFGGAFVNLVPVRDGFVAQAVAAALGVIERSQQPLEDAIVERLFRGRSLLVLDNCEHLLDAVAAFAERVLSACPDTRILATTRERLRVPGERTIHVAPLPLNGAAEALFCDRATAADPGWSADPAMVADVCARLDGLPLAIELAATRSVSLGAAGLLTAMGDYLRLLAGNRSPDLRHRSLRTVLNWSYDLLNEAEQELFRRLAIFAGDFDVAAAVRVTSGAAAETVVDVLGRLVDKSLVVHQRGTGRWQMVATVRAFAEDQLQSSGEHDEVRRRHLEWAADTARTLEERLSDRWREEFDAVTDDLRAALINAPPGRDALSHRLARSLGHLTYARRFLAESQRHYQHAAECAPTPDEAARNLGSAADCALTGIVRGSEIVDLLLASADCARAAGDGNAQAIALARVVEFAKRSPARFSTAIPDERLRQFLQEAIATGDRRDPVVAVRLALAEAWSTGRPEYGPDPRLARTAVAAARLTGDPVLISAALDGLAAAELAAGRPRETCRLSNDERLPLIDMMNRNDPYPGSEIIDAISTATGCPILVGDLKAALSVARMSLLDDLLDTDSYQVAWIEAQTMHISPLVLVGDFEHALQYATRMWDGWQRAGRHPYGRLVPAVFDAALAHGLRGDLHAYRLWRDRVPEVGGITPAYASNLSPGIFTDARVALHNGVTTGVASLVARAFDDLQTGVFMKTYSRATSAELAVAAGLPDAADRLAEAAPAGEHNDWAAACLARATGRLYNDHDALSASVEGWEGIGARFERACTLLLLSGRAAEGRAELTALGVPQRGSALIGAL